ncbi:MAG: apolipoprotein N-acyltransferase [Actinomycetaceae bacterium]|nr:apolipoprotein N-acyltransferase [Actinomycetaceae bacterium]
MRRRLEGYVIELPARRRLIDYVFLILAVAGTWASFPYVGAYYLIYPSLALLVAVVDRSRLLRGTWYAFVFGLGFFLLHIWWATVSVGSYLPWFALAFIQALFVGLWGLSIGLIRTIDGIRHSPLLYSLAVALAWVGIEQLRGSIPFGGFPWAYVAYSQVDAPLGKLAPWGSEVTIGIAVVVVATLLRRAFSLVPSHAVGNWWARPFAIVCAAGLLIAPAAIELPASDESGTIRVGIIQGNVEQPVNETYSTPYRVTNNHAKTTEAALDAGMSADLIVWGENSLDRDPRHDAKAEDILTGVVNRADTPFIVGVVRHDTVRYNELITWYPGGRTDDFYTKQRPVPFGEYIPLRQYLSILSKETAKVSVDMVGGTEPGILEVDIADRPSTQVAVGICFEAAYEDTFAEGVRLGGEFIVVPTNNSSFGYAPEAVQQLQMVRLRAMSLSRSAMQVSTNGVSAIIRPNGEMRSVTGLFESTWRVESIPLRESLTFSARYLHVLSWGVQCALGALTIIGLISFVRKRYA